MEKQFWLSVAEIAARYGVSRVTAWRHAQNGTLTAPVRLSPGCTRWPAHEVEAIDRARLAGADDDAIRALVKKLVADRAAAAQAA